MKCLYYFFLSNNNLDKTIIGIYNKSNRSLPFFSNKYIFSLLSTLNKYFHLKKIQDLESNLLLMSYRSRIFFPLKLNKVPWNQVLNNLPNENTVWNHRAPKHVCQCLVNEPVRGHENRLQPLSAVTLLYTLTKLLLPSQLELFLLC